MIYWMIETNIISQKSELSSSLQNKVPDGAIYFEGIVSNGDLNRNWYIIDSNAWFFDKGKYVKNFLKSWSVLYSHDSDKPIWRPLSFELDWDDIKVSWYVFDDIHTNWAIGRGLVLGLSTWHITHERMWQNTKGKRILDSEFWDLPYDVIFSNEYTMVVTKAEIVEFSFVTTPSNRASTLVNEFSQKLKKDPNEVESLFIKYNSMNKKELEVKANAEETIETNEVKAEEVTTDTNAIVETNEVDTLKNEVETLKNEIASRDSSIETLKNEVSTKDTEINSLKDEVSKKETELNSLKDEAKGKILAEVNKTEANKVTENTEVNSIAEFKQKYK